MKKSKSICDNPYFIYTLLFMAVGFFSFFWFLYYKKSLLGESDGFDQYYSLLVSLRHFCKNILYGKGINLWSWAIGLGADVIGNFAVVYADPFSYIAALFPSDKIDLGFGVSEYLRLYAAGISMLAFLRYQGISRIKCLIGSISYTFSMWTMVSLLQVFFLNQLILFPLIMLGIDKVEREKKPLLLIISVAVSLITSIYFSFMTAFMIAIYIVVRFFLSDEEKSIKIFFARIFSYIGYVMISVMISAVIMLPALWTLLHANQGSDAEFHLFYNVAQMIRFLPGFVTGTEFFGNYSAIAVGALFIVSIPAMVICFGRKKNRLPILMFFLNCIFLAFPVFSIAFNGFSYATARWCYMFEFFFVWAGISSLDSFCDTEKESRKMYKAVFGVITGILCFSVIFAGPVCNLLSKTGIIIALINFVFIFVDAKVLLSSGKHSQKTEEKKMLMLAALNISLVLFVCFCPLLSDKFHTNLDLGVAAKKYSSSVLKDAQKIQDTDFYRVDYVEHMTPRLDKPAITTYHWACNESFYSGVPSTYTYLSTLDSQWSEFNQMLCNNSGYTVRVISDSNDNRSRMNFLLGVKYFAALDKKGLAYLGDGYHYDSKIADTLIYKNDYDVGLGYVYSNVMNRSEFEKYSYLDREQILMQTAVVEDDYDGNVKEIQNNGLQTETNPVPYNIESATGLKISGQEIKVLEKGAKLVLSTDQIEESELYLYLSDFHRLPPTAKEKRKIELPENATKLHKLRYDINNLGYKGHGNFDLYVSKDSCVKAIRNYDGLNNQANGEMCDYLSNLGYYEKTAGDIVITFDTPGIYTYDSIQLLSVSQKNFDIQASKLEANRFEVNDMGNNYVKGTVNSDGGLLYFNILNSGGWKIYIDGKRVDKIHKTNIGFIGIDITEGSHDVELQYRPVGFLLGMILSVLGVIVTVGVVIANRKVGRKKR